MDRMSLLFAAAASALIAPAEAAAIDRWQAHIAEATNRFGIPENWIRAVIDAKSRGNPRAVSPKGAMGLMQLMPATWEELRVKYNLGADPYRPQRSDKTMYRRLEETLAYLLQNLRLSRQI